MNKDASLQAMKLGVEAKNKGDLDKALRMFEKSNRLFPSDTAETLIKEVKLMNRNSSNNNASSSSSSTSTSSSSTHKSKSRSSSPTRPRPSSSEPSSSSQSNASNASSTTASGSGSGSSVPLTAEVEKLVVQIVEARSLYHCLGMRMPGERGNQHLVEFSESAAKKQYRKVALKVHPDKCSHPKAEDAFKKASHAYQTLSDSQKRAIYDQAGDEGLQRHQSSGGRGGGPGFGGPAGFSFAEEMTPEELFEMFFFGRAPQRAAGGGTARRRQQQNPFQGATFTFSTGGGFPGGARTRVFRQQQQQQGSSAAGGGGGLRSLCVLLGPMMFLFLFSLLSGLLTPDDYYQLHRTPPYTDLRRTEPTASYPELRFYVKPEFDKMFSSSQQAQIHRMVRNDYRDICQREASRVRNAMYYSFFSGTYQHTARSKTIPTPFCDALGYKVK